MSEIFFPSIDLKSVKGVLIDLDDTLYSYKYYHPSALLSVYNFAKLNEHFSNFEDFHTIYRSFRDQVLNRLKPHGSCRSRLLAFQILAEKYKLPAPYRLSLDMDACYWNYFYKNISADKNAISFLNQCREYNCLIGIVTDMTTEVQIRKLEALGILGKIQFLTTSEEVGAEKPEKIIFETALQKFELKSHECIMVGDSPEKDILGAKNVGIPAFQVVSK